MSERSEGQQERKRGEGSLEAPTRHPIRWKEPGFYDEAALNAELATIAYHVPCHQRVQNMGPKTAEVLALVPGTSIERIERCSGPDGTYGVKRESHEIAVKIGRSVVSRMAGADRCTSDCPLAASHLEHEYKRQKAGGLSGEMPVSHPLSLLRFAYGI